MDIFEVLGDIYKEIDTDYAIKADLARLKGKNKKETELYTKRKLNDQAYFLFMFTRIEDRVRNLSGGLINENVSSLSDWKSKRSWDIIKTLKDRDSLHFMNRVALLTQKGSFDYNLVNDYYKQRNNIGHGGTFSISVNIPIVIKELTRLNNDLAK